MTVRFNYLFIIRPTNARMWHKVIFKVGPVAGPKSTRVRRGQKYLRPVGIPLKRQTINPTPPPEEGKSLGDGPPEARGTLSAEAHPTESPRGKMAYLNATNNWRGKIREIALNQFDFTNGPC